MHALCHKRCITSATVIMLIIILLWQEGLTCWATNNGHFRGNFLVDYMRRCWGCPHSYIYGKPHAFTGELLNKVVHPSVYCHLPKWGLHWQHGSITGEPRRPAKENSLKLFVSTILICWSLLGLHDCTVYCIWVKRNIDWIDWLIFTLFWCHTNPPFWKIYLNSACMTL